MQATIYFDGGSRGNPGVAAGAAVITIGGEPHTVNQKLDHATNNEAEYIGLIVGVKHAIELGATELVIRGDSKLVVEQVNGRWRCNHEHLMKLRDEAIDLLKTVNSWQLEWVKRDQNKAADAAVNRCIDGLG